MTNRITPITMPKWGIEMQEGTITDWHVAPGRTVAKGDPLLDVETEKIVNSVEAPFAGTLRRIVADKGATERVGALIAVFADPSVAEAEVDAFVTAFRPADTSFEPGGAAEAAAPPPPPAPAAPAAPAAEADGGDGEARVSPIARRLAEKLGVDVALIKGTGRNGRVSKEDVEAYVAAREAGPAVPAPSSAAPAANPSTRERLTSMRSTIARRLLESKQSIPHYRLAVDVDFGPLLAAREALKASGTAASVNDLIVRAAALALVRHPALNAEFVGDEVVRYAHADICVAVATPNGLVTPIVRAAETKSVASIATAVADLAVRARSGSLRREEIQGGTFTVSNLGMYGVDRFDGIINPPQVAILTVGAARPRVVAQGHAAVVTPVATLTLACDHRVIDGAVGGQFLATLRELLESPQAL